MVLEGILQVKEDCKTQKDYMLCNAIYVNFWEKHYKVRKQINSCEGVVGMLAKKGHERTLTWGGGGTTGKVELQVNLLQ